MKLSRKVIILISALALIISAIAVLSVAIGASDSIPQMSIERHNLSLSDSIYIKYAAKLENVDVNSVKLLVWETPQAEYVYPDADGDCTVISDKYYDESRHYDIKVVSTLGLTKKDVKSKYFKFEFIGSGNKVIDQIPKKNTYMNEGNTIVIILED